MGEQKPHRLLFRFGLGPETHEISEQRARAFQTPLTAQVPPTWFEQRGVLGEVPSQDIARWPLYERYVRLAFEPNPDFDPGVHGSGFGNTTLLNAIARYQFHGWQDYGDVPLDYEAFGESQAGQVNPKYWFAYGAWNPNRNYNSPSIDLFLGVPDLILAYYLTGGNRFRDVAMEGLAAMENLSLSFSDFSHPVYYRDRANLISAMIEGYRLTGDSRWLSVLHDVVIKTSDLTNKGWLANPDTYRTDEDWHWLSSFQLCQIMWTLGRFLDFREEFALPDDWGAANALAKYADFILKYFTTEYRPGRAAAWNAYYFFEPHDDPYLEINSWALLTADAPAYAFKHSGQTNYIEAAARFYTTGTIDPVWENDPPAYIDTKDMVNVMNWGLVYMRMTKPPEIPALALGVLTHNPEETLLEWDSLGPTFRYTIEYADELPALPSVSWRTGTAVSETQYLDRHPGIGQRFWRLRADH